MPHSGYGHTDTPGRWPYNPLPNATRYELMPDAVLQVEIDGGLLFFNPGYWLQFAIDTQNPDPFNLNINPLS
jgi:hypothetical protein